jgi:hypothetical protein
MHTNASSLAKVLGDKTLVFINKKVVIALHPNETFLPISIPLQTSLWYMYLVMIVISFAILFFNHRSMPLM